MKKKVILGVVAVVVIAAVVAGLMLCKAPELNMDGDYVALDGSTLTVSGDTFTCSDGTYSGTVERVARSVEYIPYNLPASDNAELNIQVNSTLENAAGSFSVALRSEGDVKYVAIYEGEEPVQYYFPSVEIAESILN